MSARFAKLSAWRFETSLFLVGDLHGRYNCKYDRERCNVLAARYRQTKINCNQDRHINQIVREGVESRNCIAGRFLLNDLLPARFRKHGHRVFLAFVPTSFRGCHYAPEPITSVKTEKGCLSSRYDFEENFHRIFSTFDHEETISIAYVHRDTIRQRRDGYWLLPLESIEKLASLWHLSIVILGFYFHYSKRFKENCSRFHIRFFRPLYCSPTINDDLPFLLSLMLLNHILF